MLNERKIFLCIVLVLAQMLPIYASDGNTRESTANTLAIPKPILKTGVSLNTSGISANTLQLANNIGLMPILERIQRLRLQVQAFDKTPTFESLNTRQDLYDATQKAMLIIQKTNLDVEFTVAEIDAERMLYDEILTTFTSDRDKLLARVNAASFISNGVLWAIAEAFDIPTYRTPRLSIPSGVIGIPAGVVPSIASMYTLKAVNGKKKTSEVEPNMLAKLFGYPTNPEIEYPNSIWQFLHQIPADEPHSKARLEQIIDRWVADANMSEFTDRQSKSQLDIMTASVAHRRGLSIATLTSRIVMLQQLQCEVVKIKRMLLELSMAVEGEKQLTDKLSTSSGARVE